MVTPVMFTDVKRLLLPHQTEYCSCTSNNLPELNKGNFSELIIPAYYTLLSGIFNPGRVKQNSPAALFYDKARSILS